LYRLDDLRRIQKSFRKGPRPVQAVRKDRYLEPPVKESVKILKGLRSRYEEHHEIEYTDAALKAACELSAKYINDRFLPDKAIDVIDEAGAAIRLSGAANRKKIHPSDIEKIVAKIARIPAVNVSTPDKAKLENLGS
jgi:ATP-dependent Clp protease ATP-binding subunit ClpA